jgi:hypothetical protein
LGSRRRHRLVRCSVALRGRCRLHRSPRSHGTPLRRRTHRLRSRHTRRSRLSQRHRLRLHYVQASKGIGRFIAYCWSGLRRILVKRRSRGPPIPSCCCRLLTTICSCCCRLLTKRVGRWALTWLRSLPLLHRRGKGCLLHTLLHGTLLLLLLLLPLKSTWRRSLLGRRRLTRTNIGWWEPSLFSVARAPPPSSLLTTFRHNDSPWTKGELRLTNIALEGVLRDELHGM